MKKLDEKEKQDLEFEYDNFKLIDMYSDYGDITGIQTIKRFIQHVNKHFGKMNESIIEFIRLYTDLTEIQDSFTAFITAWNEMVETHETFLQEVRDVLESWIDDPRVQAWITERLDLMIAEELPSKLDKSVFESFKTQNTLNMNKKADKTDMTSGLALKADKTQVDGIVSGLALKADKNALTSGLALKADKTEVNDSFIDFDNSVNRRIQLFSNSAMAFAHRGLSEYLPENSTYSMHYACMMGFQGLETDVNYTSDKEIYLMHDDTLNRTTDGTGAIRSVTSTYVDSLRLKQKGEYPFSLRVPKLIEILEIVKKYNVKLLLELKSSWTEEMVKKIVDEVTNMGLHDNIVLMSFEYENIVKINNYNPSVLKGYVVGTVSETVKTRIEGMKNILLSLSYTSNVESLQDISKWAKLNKVPTTVWTVDSETLATDALKSGIDSITTNKIMGFTPRKTTRSYSFNKSDGEFKYIRKYGHDFCSVEKYNGGLRIVHGIPYSPSHSAAPETGQSVARIYAGAPQKYTLATQSETQTDILIYAYENGEKINMDALPSPSWFILTIDCWDGWNIKI